jgi:hypothetical protein
MVISNKILQFIKKKPNNSSSDNNKILLITPFKVGSSSLCSLLVNSYNYNMSWESDANRYAQYSNNKFILRGHTGLDDKLISANKFDIWFTIIRKPSDIYISGYFQDINNRAYPYCFGDKNKVLSASPTDILNHFLTFDWTKYAQFSYNFNFSSILKYTGVDIWKEPFNKETGYTIYTSSKRKMKVVVLTLSVLHNNINAVLRELGITRDANTSIPANNISSEKWYGKQYSNVKKILPAAYFERYKESDRTICDKFGT